MARRSGKSRRAAETLTKNLMLAPAVMAMRMPILAAEAGRHGAWPVETIAAASEKAAAVAEGIAGGVDLALLAGTVDRQDAVAAERRGGGAGAAGGVRAVRQEGQGQSRKA